MPKDDTVQPSPPPFRPPVKKPIFEYKFYIFGGSIVLVLIVVVALVLSGHRATRNASPVSSTNPLASSLLPSSTPVTPQPKVVSGKITKVNGTTLTVIDQDKHSSTYTLASKMTVYVPIASSNRTVASDNAKDIILNQTAFLTLDDKNQVTVVEYAPVFTPPKTISTPGGS